jgi:hypothetical protein
VHPLDLGLKEKDMAPCRAICVGFFGVIAIIVTIALVLGRGSEAKMGEVDKAAIAKSGKVRIQQGGLVNFTGIKVNAGDGSFPIGTMLAILLGVGLAVAAGVWMRRQCKKVNIAPQEIELDNVPMADPEMQPSLEEEEGAPDLPGSKKELDTDADRHPVMLALMDSLED